MEKGMRLHQVREDIVQLLNEKTSLTRVKETPLLAEFSREPGEAVEVVCSDGVLSALTARGGIRITALPEMRPVASESITRESWSHRVALCLTEASGAMGQRYVLKELGPDHDALRDHGWR
jgi:hypothetical protein